MEEDYEIIPKSEILELKKEIEKIKENPLQNTPSNLLDGINQLNGRILQLIEVFSEATDELKKEDKSHRNKENEELINKIKDLENQNRDIASAMVDFAEKMGKIQEQFNKFMEKLDSRPSLQPKPVITQGQKLPFGEPIPTPSQNNIPPPFGAPPNPMNPPNLNSNNRPFQHPLEGSLHPNMPPSMPPPPPPKRN